MKLERHLHRAVTPRWRRSRPGGQAQAPMPELHGPGPVREPCPPKCCYPDMRRSNPTYEAPGTTATIWEHQSGGGLAEDGWLNASERPLSRSVSCNRPKVLIGRSQNGDLPHFACSQGRNERCKPLSRQAISVLCRILLRPHGRCETRLPVSEVAQALTGDVAPTSARKVREIPKWHTGRFV